MTGAVFGLIGALLIGISDLFGRRVVAASSATTAAAAMQLFAAFTGLGALAIVSSEFGGRDLAIGAVSGIGLAIGLGCYFGGIARSSSTVVAPLVATLSALVPFTYTLVRGAEPSALAIAGSALAFSGLVLITMGGGGHAVHIPTGLKWGLLSGLGYGFGLTILIEATPESGVWPAASQRIVAFAILITVARMTSVPTTPPPGVRTAAVMAGIITGMTTIVFLLGVQADAAQAVVTFSMFPAFSVAIGRLFFKDPVSRLQAVGLLVVLVGIAGVVSG